MEVDLLPIIEPTLEIVFMLLGILLAALAGWAVKKFSDKLGAEETEKLLAYVENMIDKGVVVARKKSLQELQERGFTDAKIKEAQIAFVVQYVVNQAPIYMSKLNLDEDKIKQLIESKI